MAIFLSIVYNITYFSQPPSNHKIEMSDTNADFVLRALNLDGKGILSLFEENRERLDWKWILPFTEEFKVCGLFVHRLERLGISPRLPSEAKKRIVSLKKEASQKTHNARLTLEQINGALSGQRIPFLVLKGILFSHEAYDHPDVRPFHDIDLLVPERELGRAGKVLESLGYRFYCPPVEDMRGFIPLGKLPGAGGKKTYPEDVTRDLFDRFNFHYPYVLPSDDPRLPVDLHWNLFPSSVVRIDPESLWDQMREKSVGDIVIKTLGLEATILFLAKKIAVEGPIELLSLCDFVRYLDLFAGKRDPDILWRSAGKWKALRDLRFSLNLAERLFGFDGWTRFGFSSRKRRAAGAFFYLSTSPSLLFDYAIKKRSLSFFFKLKNLTRRFLWDLSTGRLPRRTARSLVRMGAGL